MTKKKNVETKIVVDAEKNVEFWLESALLLIQVKNSRKNLAINPLRRLLFLNAAFVNLKKMMLNLFMILI